MQKTKTNRIVLAILFIVPLIFYLFLSSGINNFAKLPVVTPSVIDINNISENKLSFENKISIVCFLGSETQNVKGTFFNLNQKIYKPFYGFKDFQIIGIYPKGEEKEIEKLEEELGAFTNMIKWKFVSATENNIKTLFNSFKTTIKLDSNLFTNYAFIIDKEGNLRGRTEDKDLINGILYGYNMVSVSELNDKMKDDIKVVLAEYRLALKKNDANREI